MRGIAQEHRYLLLLGDADPQHGDVPMFTVWPRHMQPEDDCLGAFATDCRSCESDAPYADLQGDWDLDHDGRAGEHGEDDGPGGISFEARLIVGRIPVYFGDAAEADRILAHAIAYAGQTADEARYRRRVLLPSSIFYYRGQRLTGTAMLNDVDGASFADWLVRHELAPRPELSFTRLYEREGARPSVYASDGALTQQAVIDAFGEGAGVVIWSGHGMPRERFGSDNAAAVILRGLLDGRGAAEALAEAKRTLGEAATAEDLAGKMMLNHFGDPTLTLDDLAPDSR